MGSHYFINDPKLKKRIRTIEKNIDGIMYRFYTDSGVFSKSRVDFGTTLLIKAIKIDKKTKLFLDLGCGYGPIGIVMKKKYPNLNVHQTDVNEKAVSLTLKNADLNDVKTQTYYSKGFSKIKERFDIISLNPPIRAGKKMIYELYNEAYNNLNNLGSLWIVIRKKQGALSHLDYLNNLFENVIIIQKSKGYYVIKAEKLKNA